MAVRHEITTEDQFRNFRDIRAKMLLYGKPVIIEFIANQKTDKQRAALHVWLELLAGALNDAGYDQAHYPYKDGFDVPWTKLSCKEVFFKPLEKLMFGHDSTEDASTVTYNDVYKAICRALAMTLDGFVPPPWPDRFNQGGEND